MASYISSGAPEAKGTKRHHVGLSRGADYRRAELQGDSLGFPFLATGIVSGAVWANYAWGTYWSWDPKETWSLITWFIYAAYLHARVTRGWRGKRAAYISIAGFLAVIFLYWGVSFVLPGLHAYAS